MCQQYASGMVLCSRRMAAVGIVGSGVVKCRARCSNRRGLAGAVGKYRRSDRDAAIAVVLLFRMHVVAAKREYAGGCYLIVAR